MNRTGSFSLVNRTFEQDNKKYPKLRGSVGSELHGLEQDRAIKTEPGEARRRRTIRLHRNRGQSWGFTLQTYGIRNKRTREVEIMSYVDYVEVDGSAWMAGMRRGDIILSINGESVELCTHRELVRRIQKCTWELRLVVLFEDCCQKVELHERYLKLKRLLSQKVKELRELEAEERKIRHKIPLSRCDSFRQSTYSSTSSDWDIYSEITSPTLYDSVPVNRFAFRENCNQSFSDISTESSINSDSLSSVSSFIHKGEEDSLSLKSSSIAEDEGKAYGGKIRIARDSNFLSSSLAEDSDFSSEILEKEDSIIIQSHLAEHNDGSRFIEDDRLASFIQDRHSSILHDELEDNIRFSCGELKNNIPLANEEDEEEEDAPISFQCSFQEERREFSHAEIEERQRYIKCELEQMDSDEKQNEVGCRHSFPGSVDSVVQSCDVLPEVSECLTFCYPTSSLPTTNSPSITTLCTYEEDSVLASNVQLQAGDILSQVLVALPYENGSAETGTAFSHQEGTTPRQSEAEDCAQFGQDGDSITGLTCDDSATAFNRQDCTTPRQSEAEECAQFEQDTDSITGLTCIVSASCLTEASGYCNSTSKQGNISSGCVCTDLGFSLDAPLCDACKHVAVNCSGSKAKCQDGYNNTKIQDISDRNPECQDIIDIITENHDFGNSIKCQDSNNSHIKCQVVSSSNIKYEDISNIKCQEISNSGTKFQDRNNSQIKCQDINSSNTNGQDISNSNTKSQDIIKIKCQDNSSIDIKGQDSPNSTRYTDSSSQDNCSQCQDSDHTCLSSAVASGKSDACTEYKSQTSQTVGDLPPASSVPALSGLFSHSAGVIARSQDHSKDQAYVSSKKRLINGVLVNDRSYSTRL